MPFRALVVLMGTVHAVSPAAACKRDVAIASAIESLARSRTVEAALPHLRVLERRPYESICHLVKVLHPIRPTRLGPDDADSDSWKVIWAIRGLRFLTGGKDFVARTRFNFSAADNARRDLLEGGRNMVVPFFRVWPSRDITFIAPRDAQVAIIGLWRQWFERDASAFVFRSAGDLDRWYF